MSYGDESYGAAVYGGDASGLPSQPSANYEIVRLAAVRSGASGAADVRSKSARATAIRSAFDD